VVGADPLSGCVELRTGERLYADIIVGADGYDSVMRPLVSEFSDIKNQELHLLVIFVVPVVLLRGDKDLRSLVDPKVVCPAHKCPCLCTNIISV
jgi:salicylate hydroxylase